MKPGSGWVTYPLEFKVLFLSFQEAWVNTLVCAEIAFWFFIGEQIGRRSFIGYNIKSDYEPAGYI